MNIKQALKKKNKLVGMISEEFHKASQYNVVDEGNPRPYSATEAIGKWMQLTNELIVLKTAIHKANAPIYDKIFELSELKNQVKHLKSLNCSSGKVAGGRWGEGEPVVKHAEINIVERDGMVKSLETRIESLQDQLDQWNHTTLIEFTSGE
jgi:hypothetical protein